MCVLSEQNYRRSRKQFSSLETNVQFGFMSVGSIFSIFMYSSYDFSGSGGSDTGRQKQTFKFQVDN